MTKKHIKINRCIWCDIELNQKMIKAGETMYIRKKHYFCEMCAYQLDLIAIKKLVIKRIGKNLQGKGLRW